MLSVVSILLVSISAWFRSRLSVQIELIALRHQVAVYKQSVSRPKLRPTDRILWVWLSRLWPSWQEVLEFVQPRTVIAWQKKRFRNLWSSESRPRSWRSSSAPADPYSHIFILKYPVLEKLWPLLEPTHRVDFLLHCVRHDIVPLSGPMGVG